MEMLKTALELGVYLPLGAAMAARDLVLDRERLAELYEELVDRGRESLGSVVQGPREQLERVKVEAGDLTRRGRPRLTEATDGRGDVATTSTSGRTVSPAVDQLPIQSYDLLTADEIVRRLSELSRAELEVVREYESRGRSRSTILDRIDKLARR